MTAPDLLPPKRMQIRDLEKGFGVEAQRGDRVTVQYVGINYKSGREFDSSWSRGEPLIFTVGAGEMIAGLDQGMPGMKVGGRREFIVPPELAYGEAGYPPIPPNETLIYVVDLVEVR